MSAPTLSEAIAEALSNQWQDAETFLPIAEIHPAYLREALSTITTQAKRIETQRKALARFIYATTHLSQQENDGSHWCKISAACLDEARQALGDDHAA